MNNGLQQLVGRLTIACLALGVSAPIYAQSRTTFQYFYDDYGQLTKVIDSSSNEIDYTYDSVGNILQVTRGMAPASGALAILDFTPQSGGVGTVVTIQGQNFSPTLTSNAVSFNSTAATVLSATATTLTASVPVGATTGPISVTVVGNTTTSTTTFTFIPGPAILSISPQFFVSSTSATQVPSFQVTGAGLTGSTFSFAPAFIPPPITVNSATINPAGTSATLNLTIAPGTLGSLTLIGTNSGNSSSPVPTSANTLQIVTPDVDSDGDGLTNAVEVAIGSNPLNANTSGDGLPDGWQVFYGLNPLDPTVAGKSDGAGSTILQDYQKGLSPISLNRVAPSVSQVTPKNGATSVYVNNAVVMRFSEPLLIGTSLSAAQSAIANALGSGTTVPTSSQLIAGQTLDAYMNRTCCGNSVIAGTVTLTGPAGQVHGTATPSADGLSATFSPSLPLQSNTQYSVRVVGVRDAAGNLMTNVFTSSFTTGSSQDLTPPQLAQTSPVNGASNVATNVSVVVTFSKAIDPTSVNSTSFSLVDTTANLPVAGSIQVDSTNAIATFVPSQPLTMGDFFAVTLTTAVKDQGGNSLLGNASFGFTTGGIAQEADSLTFSVLNGVGPAPQPTQSEADSLTFSVLNGNAPLVPPGLMESDSLTFSVLNGASPIQPTSTLAEADSFTFSLLNNSGPVQPTTNSQESDSITFSLLNGEPPLGGATVYEADSLTFSVWNQAPTTGKAASPSRFDAYPTASSTLVAKATGIETPIPGPGSRSSHAGTQIAEEDLPQPTEHQSALTTVLNRLMHRRPFHKRNSVSMTGAATSQPDTKANYNSKPKSNSASAAAGEVAASPGQL